MVDRAYLYGQAHITTPIRRPVFQRLETDSVQRPRIRDLEIAQFFSESVRPFSAFLNRARRRMRSKQLLLLAGICFCAATIGYLWRRPVDLDLQRVSPFSHPPPPPPHYQAVEPPLLPPGTHPIDYLIEIAEKEFDKTASRQSTTLEAAVSEYQRRYGIPPPPNFDKWYAFAVERGVQLIDEFDTIYEVLTPFWGLKPSTIRSRAKESLGFEDNSLIGLSIRNGMHIKTVRGEVWQQDATLAMMSKFLQYLPDMDLCFNIHDEPRVVVPHEDLLRLVAQARHQAMPAARATKNPRNSWSVRPKDMNDGSVFEEVKTTRFNRFAHQPTWTHSRMSCSPHTPARSLEDSVADEVGSYALGDFGFLYNHTAFSDICQSPSLSKTFGFFDRPNAFNIVHELFPIFSQSKISSFQDIIYPSPWYWIGKVPYEPVNDTDWDNKEDQLYWRGSTTGGFSRDGGWRRQHRQRFVQNINADDIAMVMTNTGTDRSPKWKSRSTPRSDYASLINVKFSHVGQCDQADCTEQVELFGIAKPAGQQDAWKWKHLLDIDGNAFSGRFYAFLLSKSLVFKMAVFREWHMEWLKPWIHYVPLSLKGDEWLESVRYFSQDSPGKRQAERLAEKGSRWAEKVLRNEDLEVWFFRLLLEYGRLVDDDREIIGFRL